MLITVLIFGVHGKDRNWMPRWQHNWFGWSFSVAIIACMFEFTAGKEITIKSLKDSS